MTPKQSLRYLNSAARTLVFLILVPLPASAQTNPFERIFTEPRTEVENAVASAKASFSGKLPALEGFVGQAPQPVERYERAYYQCLFQVIPALSGETSFRVTAKITAWYDDPDKQRSGYQVLPSNGRLENDALDRVQEILEGPIATRNDSAPPPKYNLSVGSGLSRPRLGAAVSVGRPSVPVVASTSVTEEEIEGLRAKRAASDRRVQQLNNALKNLQELYDSRTEPANIVAVRKNGTPVYARPDEGGKSLFNAVSKDQFEMIELRNDWVHIQISGESRGWIRKALLELPDENRRTGSTETSASGVSASSSSETFRVVREEAGTFPGNWESLRAKSVKILTIQPAQSAAARTTAQQKRAFAKEIFLRSWKDRSLDSFGVAIIFDSADGGQISATFESLEQWQSGKISEAEFWQQCLLDPPEAFDANPRNR